MDVDIVGRHITLTDAMREHALEKIEHLSKYSDLILRVRATLSADADQNVAEVLASVRRSSPLVGEARSDDMYNAIDAAVAKVQEQVRRHKDRSKGHRARARASDVLAPAEEPDEDDDSDVYDEDDYEEPEATEEV